MKIEIEFEQVENLKNKITYLEEENTKLQNKIRSLDENVLKEQSYSTAIELTKRYMTAIFRNLGFKDTETLDISIVHPDLCKKWLDEDWQNSQKLTTELEVQISKKIKKIIFGLFININK